MAMTATALGYTQRIRRTRGDTIRVDATLTRPGGLEATATVVGGAVTAITVANGIPSTGDPLGAVPTVVLVDPLGVGVGATATAVVTNGELTGITVTAGGSGYSSSIPPKVIIGPINLTGSSMVMTAKRALDSTTYVFRLTSAAGSIALTQATAGRIRATIPPDATSSLTDWPTLYVDLELTESDTTVSTPLKFRLEIQPDASVPGGVASPFDDGGEELETDWGPFEWQENGNARAELLAQAFNNGGNPSAFPRNRPILAADLDSFDATTVNANAKGFQLGVFDGRRAWFLPYGDHRPETNPPGPRSGILIYDTRLSFTDPASYQYVDLRLLLGNEKAEGFLGGCLDRDGYLYLVPCLTDNGTGTNAGCVGNNLFVRHNTSMDADDVDAWETYEYPGLTDNGWCNAVYDGRYIYYGPINDNHGGAAVCHGNFVRYDTTLPFDEAASWTTYNPATALGVATLKGFQGLVFDGNHIYAVPFWSSPSALGLSGRILRYDVTGSFTSAGSWEHFDLTTLNSNAKAYDGAVFDGRYLYMAGWGAPAFATSLSVAARFDTRGPVGGAANSLSNPNNWTFFDHGTIPTPVSVPGSFSPGRTVGVCRGYQWGWFDGIYAWFVPTANDVEPQEVTPGIPWGRVPPLMRYDTRQDFDEVAAWGIFDLGEAQLGAYPPTSMPCSTGAIWDGRFAYLVPYGFAAVQSGRITRIRCYVPDGSLGGSSAWESTNHFEQSTNGYVGFGTKTPTDRLDVAGSLRQYVGGSVQSGRVPGVVGRYTPVAAIPNTGVSETTLASVLLPAGMFGAAGHTVRMVAWGVINTTANNKTWKVYLGGTTPVVGLAYAGAGTALFNSGALAINGGSWFLEVVLFRRETATISQPALTRLWITDAANALTYRQGQVVPTADGTIALPLVVTGQSSAAGSDVFCTGMLVMGEG